MGQLLGDYILNNWLDILFSILIGFIPALVLVKKNPSSSVQNNTKIYETIKHIDITIRQSNEEEKKKSTNFDIYLLLFAVVIASFLFISYYDIILDIYASIIVVIITATLAIAFKLYNNDQYDHLNRFWTVILLIITAFNFCSLSIMAQLDLANTDLTSFSTIFHSVGMSGFQDYIYRTIGFILALLLNILGIILLIHIISVNNILLHKNIFYNWFVKRTINYTKPKFLIIMVLCFATLSLMLTSGLLIEMIKDINNYHY